VVLWTAADAALLVLALATLGFFRRPAPEQAGPVRWRTCVGAPEGDVLLLDDSTRVRLVGVNTPDLGRRRPDEPGSHEAREFTRTLTLERRVRLEPAGPSGRDQIGRALAYAYLEDGTFVNAEIVRRGWSPAYDKYAHPHLRKFEALEREARRGRRGLWAGGMR
jgi:micrococcal nuclease